MGETTGVKMSIDWLGFTFAPEVGIDWAEKQYGDDVVLPTKNEFQDQVLFAASVALGCGMADWVDLDAGMWGYHRVMQGPGGARLLFDAPGRDDFHISFPGKACDLISESSMRSWLNFALVHHGKPTRCDINIDDWDRVVSPGDVLVALQGRDAVTHAKRCLMQRGSDVGSPETTGHTVYLGQPSSRQRLRVYDKGLESDGEIDAVRWELQARDEPAQTLVAKLATQDWADTITRRLVAFVDFKDAASSSHVELRDRLPWYERLVRGAVKASAYLPKLPKTVDQLIDWFDRQIGTTLAVAMRYWEGDLAPLWRIAKEGEKRFKPKHLAMLARAV